MKRITLSLYVLLLSACMENGQLKMAPVRFSPVEHERGALPAKITAHSSKHHVTPNAWIDFSYKMPKDGWVSVPQVLFVLQGNAGDKPATVKLGKNTCLFRGGANISQPLLSSDQVEIDLGQKYLLEGCLDESGSVVYGAFEFQLKKGEVVSIHLDEGDSSHFITKIETNFYLHE